MEYVSPDAHSYCSSFGQLSNEVVQPNDQLKYNWFYKILTIQHEYML